VLLGQVFLHIRFPSVCIIPPVLYIRLLPKRYNLTNWQPSYRTPTTRWHSWLRQCATSRHDSGSIPDSVIRSFHWHNPSGRTMALDSTQPLTEISTGSTSRGGKGGLCVGLTMLHVSTVFKSGSLNFLEHSGTVPAYTGIALPLSLPLPMQCSCFGSNKYSTPSHIRWASLLS